MPDTKETTYADLSPEFRAAWTAAGEHIERMAREFPIRWIRSHLFPPYHEHLAFRLGNQLFFVMVVDLSTKIKSPGNLHDLVTFASTCNGYACIMPMRQINDQWRAALPGWGLLEVRSRKPLHPPDTVRDEKVPMTQWELHDFAMQVVRARLQECGCRLLSWHSDQMTCPSLWFSGAHGDEWAIVLEARYPQERPAFPHDWNEIIKSCAASGCKGYSASVILIGSGFNAPTPGTFYRDEQIWYRFLGLRPAEAYYR